jgi:hypothetical protein
MFFDWAAGKSRSFCLVYFGRNVSFADICTAKKKHVRLTPRLAHLRSGSEADMGIAQAKVRFGHADIARREIAAVLIRLSRTEAKHAGYVF